MASLTVRLLGLLQVWRGDQLVAPEEWPTQKTKALLKILLTERGHVVPKERLMEFLWPDVAPRSAVNSLNVAISYLRRILEPALDRPADSTFIRTHRQGYTFQVTPDCWIDVDAFWDAMAKAQQWAARGEWGPAIATYQAAADLYRGDYLEEDPYEDWANGPREQIREAYLDVLSRLAACYAQLGRYRRALTTCQKLLTVDPLRESAYRQVMAYHYRLGQRDQALRAFERCRETLAEELGVDPMPQTVELHTRILRQETVEEPVPTRPIPTPTRPGQPPLPAWLPFIGRDVETEALVGHLATAMGGQGRLVLIAGEAGVGKTRLAQEFLALAEERGAQVFQSRAYELERDLPYQSLREGLRRYLLRRLDPDGARRVLGAWAPHVALLVPEIRQVLPDLPTFEPLPPEEERQRLLMALTRFSLSLAAQRPVVFFLDDAQWADPSTLQFLHMLVRHIATEPLMALVTYRAEEVGPDHPLMAVERHLAREGLAVRLDLERLSAEAVTQLVEQKAAPGWDSAAFSQRLYRETEGNPLFLAELLRSLLEAGLLTQDDTGRWQPAPQVDLVAEALSLPATVQAVIEARYQAAGPMAQQVLYTAAVNGRTFTYDLLRRASDLDAEGLLGALDDLLSRQLIIEQLGTGRSRYNFSHDKIRQVIYQGLSDARRIHLHGKVAAALEAMYEGRTEEIAAQLARHYAEAGAGEKAVKYLLQAGDRARRLYAYQEAIDHYQRALAFLSKRREYERAARTLMKLGLTYHLTFDFQRARQAYREGFDLWQRSSAVRPARLPAAPHALRADWGDPTTLDPTVAGDIPSAGIIDQLFSGLVELSPEMNVVPAVARTWEVAEGGRRYVFHLRDDVRWSDGTPVTADDFEFAWKRVLDPALESPNATLLYDVKGARAFHQSEVPDPDRVGVRALDKFTLAVELEAPIGHFPLLLTCCAAYPVPRHVVETHGDGWAEPANIVTNGPFRLEAWQRGGPLILAANPEYRGQFTGNVERVELSLPVDRSARLAMYEADELDILGLWEFPPSEWDYARERYAGEYISIPRLHTMYVGFDVSRPPFDDFRVRRAFAHATDRETLADVVMRAYVSPATGGFIPPGMPEHLDGIGLPYDPRQARRLLAQADYPGGRGFPTVELPTFQRADLWSEYLQAQWRENLGIDIAWKIMEVEAFLVQVEEQPPHMYLSGWLADYPDPDYFLRASPHVHRTRWRNEAYVRLVEQARSVTDRAERTRMYQQADRLLIQDVAILPLTYGRLHLLVKPWVRKYPTSAIRQWFWKDVIIEPH